MILYKVEMQGLHEIEQDLRKLKDKSKMVLRNAINSTAKDVMKLLPNLAKQDYYVKQKQAKDTLKLKKATVGTLTAEVTSSGHALELYGAKVRPAAYTPKNRPKAGHTGNVKRVNPPTHLYMKKGARDQYKAFVVKYASKHISIAQRVPGTTMDKKPWKEGIRNMYTISIPQMLHKALTEEELHAATHADIEASLIRHAKEQIARYLK